MWAESCIGSRTGGGGSYKPLLEHIARRKGRRQAVIRVRQSRRAAAPTLTPGQIERICDACASWDDDVREWRGSVRNRLLWSLLAETGLRLGEALGLQHRDWCTGRGDTPFIEVVPREQREEVRAKSGLLNAGVPLHVVQRYMGHLTPAMTMEYAETLAETHEAEFLRYKKVTADGRDLQVDPRDLYDMLELDKRTDRILPNGWCLLPPRQVCEKGNACLTCEKFATDATFLPELKTQRLRTGQLIDERRQVFKARTGQEMSPDNVWLAGCWQEQDALGRIIIRIEQTRLADGSVHALRGAGVAARTDAITAEMEGSHHGAR